MNKPNFSLLTIKITNFLIIIFGFILLLTTNKFPIKNSFFDLIFLLFLFFIFLIISRKIIFSLVLSIYLIDVFLVFAITKFQFLKSNLVFNDLYFLINQPLFLLDYIKIYQLALFLIFTIFIFISYKTDKKIKLNFKLVNFLILVIFLCAYSIYFKASNTGAIWNWSNNSQSQFLLKFISTSLNNINLDTEKNGYHNSICCAKTVASDLKITSYQNKPNIVFVLLESTIDLSRIKDLNIANNPWERYASIPLQVYSSGGGTWIAEYSILHGVDPRIYGPFYHNIHLLGPISQLPGRIAPSLATVAYTSTTISPMEKDFYNSEVFHKSLGIENFLSCTELHICKQKDREMVDKIIFATIINQIKNAKTPEFIFALTMSQHSPHAKSENTINLKCKNSIDSSLCDNFSEYKKREEKLQSNIDQFINELNQLNKYSIIIFFGDHIASSFTDIKEPDANNENPNFKTIAFAYDSREKKYFDLKENFKNCSPSFNLNVSDLDVLALSKANFRSQYIDEKLQSIQKNCTK